MAFVKRLILLTCDCLSTSDERQPRASKIKRACLGRSPLIAAVPSVDVPHSLVQAVPVEVVFPDKHSLSRNHADADYMQEQPKPFHGAAYSSKRATIVIRRRTHQQDAAEFTKPGSRRNSAASRRQDAYAPRSAPFLSRGGRPLAFLSHFFFFREGPPRHRATSSTRFQNEGSPENSLFVSVLLGSAT